MRPIIRFAMPADIVRIRTERICPGSRRAACDAPECFRASNVLNLFHAPIAAELRDEIKNHSFRCEINCLVCAARLSTGPLTVAIVSLGVFAAAIL
jgi:hypothetical protein